VLAQYAKNGQLTDSYRSKLTEILVTHFNANNILLGMKECEKMEAKIIATFPTEKPGIYFFKKGNVGRGKLYEKMRNFGKVLRKLGKPQKEADSENQDPKKNGE
jgi:hypothetical protein